MTDPLDTLRALDAALLEMFPEGFDHPETWSCDNEMARDIARTARNGLPALLTIAKAAEEWASVMDFIGSPHTGHDQMLLDAIATALATLEQAK